MLKKKDENTPVSCTKNLKFLPPLTSERQMQPLFALVSFLVFPLPKINFLQKPTEDQNKPMRGKTIARVQRQ